MSVVSQNSELEYHELDQFFITLQVKREAFKENYEYFAQKLAPQFNIFNFVRRDENALSYIIKSLIDPKGEHEQKDLFLKLFMDMLKRHSLEKQLEVFHSKLPDYEQFSDIITEYSTRRIAAKGRRIDILLEFQDFGIAIENKPWAFDQPNQLKDYAEEMKLWFPNGNWFLIYLSGYEEGPSKESITKGELDKIKGKNYIQIGYGEIQEWLKACEAKCKSERVRHFLRDFSEYCNYEFLGGSNMADANVIKDYILKTNTNLALALDVQREMDTIKNEIMNKFFDQVKTNFKKLHEDWIVEKDEKFGIGRGKNQRIWLRKAAWKNHALAIENGYEGFYFGIKKLANATTWLPSDICSNLNASLNNAFESQYYSYSLFKVFDGYKSKDITLMNDFLLDINSNEPKCVELLMKEVSDLANASELVIDTYEAGLS